MLSIGLIGAHQEKYYTDLAREDYYTEGGEPPGVWFGGGTRHFRLSGTVETDALSALFSGHCPDTHVPLVKNAGSPNRRAGFDLTFNAPKSVSVLFALGDQARRRAIQEAQDEATKAALGYIEKNAARVRVGRNGADSVPAAITAALFEHSTARLVEGEAVPDPHLHTHCVIANLGVTTDGRTRTLDSRELLRHKMTAGVLYRAELFRQLDQRLGLTVTRRERFCEIDGVPDEVIAHFSKRRRAIEAVLGEGAEYGKATDAAALHTRTHKPSVDRERFLAMWKADGDALGLSGTMVAEAHAPGTRDALSLVRDGTKRAVVRMTEQQSHFAERELVRALADELEDQGVGAHAILQGAHSFLQEDECVLAGELRGETRYTTREILRLEAKMLAGATDLARRSHRVPSQHADQVLRVRQSEGKPLSDEQRSAFLHVVQGRAISIVRGVAGTGKTYMLAAAREAFESSGSQVLGAALASRAAQQLERDSGIRSSTIHSLLSRLERGDLRLSSNTVLVVDEAAMVGTRQMERLVDYVCAAAGKLVLVGDDRQLQAIEAGAPFSGMRRRLGAVEMVDIRRQKEAWAREAVLEFARGDARAALGKLVERGQVHVSKTKADAIARLVRDYRHAVEKAGFEETLVLTGTRAEARRINREVQLSRRLSGDLAGERFATGEACFFVSDRVLFKRNSRLLRISNGDRGTVEGCTAAGMTIRLDSGERVTIHESSVELVQPQLGYAATTHSSQGATVDRCFVLAGGSMQDREATYVQASRARLATRLYTDEVSAGDEMSELCRAMERSRAKSLALDLSDGGLRTGLEVA